jgi:hypothetical protein
VFIAVVAFVVPIALASSSSALPGDTTTTTTSISVPSTSTSTTMMPTTTTSTTVSTATSTTSTTQPATSTTASPPVNGEGVVVVLENGDRILAAGAVNAQADTKVLAQTGSEPLPVWLTGLACLVSGALALTFKRRRHLSLYTLRSKRS